MAKIYANLIINGDKKFEEVPTKLIDQVADILRDRGFGHLVPQEEPEEEIKEEPKEEIKEEPKEEIKEEVNQDQTIEGDVQTGVLF